MSPNLRDGDLLYIEESPTYEFGEIIVFYDENKTLIAHRIVSKLTLKTKGDRSKVLDNSFKARQIIGRVCFIQRDQFIYDFSKKRSLSCAFAFLSNLNVKSNPLRKIIFLTLWPLNSLFLMLANKEPLNSNPSQRR